MDTTRQESTWDDSIAIDNHWIVETRCQQLHPITRALFVRILNGTSEALITTRHQGYDLNRWLLRWSMLSKPEAITNSRIKIISLSKLSQTQASDVDLTSRFLICRSFAWRNVLTLMFAIHRSFYICQQYSACPKTWIHYWIPICGFRSLRKWHVDGQHTPNNLSWYLYSGGLDSVCHSLRVCVLYLLGSGSGARKKISVVACASKRKHSSGNRISWTSACSKAGEEDSMGHRSCCMVHTIEHLSVKHTTWAAPYVIVHGTVSWAVENVLCPVAHFNGTQNKFYGPLNTFRGRQKIFYGP